VLARRESDYCKDRYLGDPIDLTRMVWVVVLYLRPFLDLLYNVVPLWSHIQFDGDTGAQEFDRIGGSDLSQVISTKFE
jgi:hypothetical protein